MPDELKLNRNLLDGPLNIVIPAGTSMDLEDDAHMELVKVVLGWLVEECYDIAEASGWHEGNDSPVEKMALWHSEVTEAIEEIRDGHTPEEVYFSFMAGEKKVISDSYFHLNAKAGRTETILNKPEGVASEAADIFIRVADDSQRYGIPFVDLLILKMRYNKTRSHRHGGKTF